MASWACFFFSPLFFIYSYTICTYLVMSAVFWILGRAYGRSSNLYWVLPPTLLCTCSCHHAHAHAHAHTHTCTHTLSYTPTLACKYRLFSWLSLAATCTGIRNDWYAQFYAIVLCDSSSQWWSLVWTANSKRSTWACIHLLAHHWCKTCTLRCYVCYPLYSNCCISFALYRNNLHALCNHSHATMFIWFLIW